MNIYLWFINKKLIMIRYTHYWLKIYNILSSFLLGIYKKNFFLIGKLDNFFKWKNYFYSLVRYKKIKYNIWEYIYLSMVKEYEDDLNNDYLELEDNIITVIIL